MWQPYPPPGGTVRAWHLVTRLTAVAALAAPILIAGLAEAAHASPSLVSVESKCGYAEITIDSDIQTTLTANFYGGGGTLIGRQVTLGTNVYRLMANSGTGGGVITIANGPGAGDQWHPFTYERPEGCLQANLSARIELACDDTAVITVINTGDVPAQDVSFSRPTGMPGQAEIVADGLTVPVGESRFVAEGVGGTASRRPSTVRWGDTSIWEREQYIESTDCASVPEVHITDTCTGVDVVTTPADATIGAAVFGRTTAERPAEAGRIELADGESVLVRSGDTLITAHRFTRASCEPTPAPSDPTPAPSTPATPPAGDPDVPTATTADTLAVTGLPTGAIIATGLALVALGMLIPVAVRRRTKDS